MASRLVKEILPSGCLRPRTGQIAIGCFDGISTVEPRGFENIVLRFVAAQIAFRIGRFGALFDLEDTPIDSIEIKVSPSTAGRGLPEVTKRRAGPWISKIVA